MLNRRYSSAVLLQIMPHERDVAANFVRKNALSVPGKKKYVMKQWEIFETQI
jgi:hypothetical protein